MTNALTVSGLTKTYPDFVLDQVSFSVPSGSIVGLIGENGAGKSTTINAALGLIQKEAGQVSIFGKEGLDGDTKEEIGENKAKGIAINGIPIRKASELFGIVNMVFFSPEFAGRCAGGRNCRRNWRRH